MVMKVFFLMNLTYQLHLTRFSYKLSLVVLFFLNLFHSTMLNEQKIKNFDTVVASVSKSHFLI